ncbi:MAG: ribosome assembly cofactor RimP [Bacteroidales bacterium]|nr:ribosome assembly cofactor RimP [Bacteroidales bacterium]MBR3440039.1 ribosome assembly cofactor RimP [Bacteroidales bacterium]
MEKNLIIETIGPAVKDRGCFIVDVTVSKDNDIVLTIEKETGDVDLDDCVALNDAFLAAFDKDVEDYSLTVSSAGLDQPFKVSGQFTKAIGSQVVVLLKGGRKLTGILTTADDEGIVLRYVTREVPEGKKKKVPVEHEDRFVFADVNSVSPFVEFKK